MATLLHWSELERDEARELTRLYKEIRSTVQHGDQYRLLSPRENSVSASMYVNAGQDEAVVFAFLHSNSFGNQLPRVRLAGLDKHSLYSIDSDTQQISGEALMQIGIKLELKGDFDSAVIRITKV